MSVLDRFSEISSKIYMDGKFYKSQSTESIDVIDPATENKIGEIPETSQSEIDEVVSIANKAQKAWNQNHHLIEVMSCTKLQIRWVKWHHYSLKL